MEALVTVLRRGRSAPGMMTGQTFFAPEDLCLTLAEKAAQSQEIIGVSVEAGGETWRWARLGYDQTWRWARLGYDHSRRCESGYAHVSLFEW